MFYKSYIKLRFNCITNEDQKALNADIFSPVDFIIRCHLNQPTSDYDPNYVRFLSYFNSLMQLYNNRFFYHFLAPSHAENPTRFSAGCGPLVAHCFLVLSDAGWVRDKTMVAWMHLFHYWVSKDTRTLQNTKTKHIIS